jgi:hypothetical protein
MHGQAGRKEMFLRAFLIFEVRARRAKKSCRSIAALRDDAIRRHDKNTLNAPRA